ncbi:conjugal transfer protein TraH (plasmid) [Vibrio sp. SS-MA-C1-2]|uniref:conjugal transfer protein TraH n=1 Tax=Vibrio sp. SS-MA-C1-2 TaxID=2908646 RepID=UPI001F328763|nr:conjugal transfer protein TraH [Vibrio sp. SS-MA-C1-2]UJF20211.1 conjugal transfer protein TraH [Vibrio sp. SS-MA-C1-2]
MFNKILTIILSAMFSIGILSVANAGSPLKDVFDSYSVSHGMTTIETQKRTGVVFGSANIRFKGTEEELFNFQTPSISAGCNGIDMQLGAFSAIKDLSGQLQNAMRQIAAGAASYAFMLAIDSLCAQCSSLMQALKKKLDQLSQFFKNACEAGSKFMENVATEHGIEEKIKSNAAVTAVNEGLEDDVSSWVNKIPSMGIADMMDFITPDGIPNEDLEIYFGNVIYNAFDMANIKDTTTIGGGDWKYFELIQSITGTYIAPKGLDKYDIYSYPSQVSLSELAYGKPNGKPFTYWDCNNNTDCDEVTKVEKTNWKSLSHHICLTIMGLSSTASECVTPGDANLISVYKDGGRSKTLTSDQVALLSVSTINVYGMMRHFAVKGYKMEQLSGAVEYLSQLIAYEYARALAVDVQTQLMNAHHSAKNQNADVTDNIQKLLNTLNTQLAELNSTYKTRIEGHPNHEAVSEVVGDIMNHNTFYR